MPVAIDIIVFAAGSAAQPVPFGGPESHMAELKAVAGRIAVVREREADQPHSPVAVFGKDQPLRLDAGVDLGPFQVAYQTYGRPNAHPRHAVLVRHALTRLPPGLHPQPP